MADPKNLKLQRDRFLAFSFASSDLFIEIDAEDKIAYALGAAKGVIGIDEATLIGKSWLELFDGVDRPVLQVMKDKAKPVVRVGPMMVNMNKEISDGKKAFITGIIMPDSDKFYITLGLSNIMMSKIGEMIRSAEAGELLDKESFTENAQEVFNTARNLGQDVDITLLDLEPTQEDKQRMGNDGWSAFMDAVSTFLLSKSVDGNSAAQIEEGRYSIIHEKGIDSQTIAEQIKSLSKEQDPEGEGIALSSKTITSDVSSMSERDTARALIYTINEFERKGTGLSIENLNSGFKAYMASNAQKVKDFQGFIERLSFSLHFQPIVDLKTMVATHYEMLCRFDDGDTQEWIMFGEDIGMASEFDIAVCERAINYVNFQGGTTSTRFSINISGQSIENENFFKDLKAMLSKKEGMSKRLMFEITESAHIRDLDKVAQFVKDLRNEGYQVALDDFGAGASSFEYLQNLDVDYVKIDGKYIRKLLSSQRDLAMVKNLAQMCQDLGIKVIAEFVEEIAQVEILRELGVDYGQGYLLGKPLQDPQFKIPDGLTAIS